MSHRAHGGPGRWKDDRSRSLPAGDRRARRRGARGGDAALLGRLSSLDRDPRAPLRPVRDLPRAEESRGRAVGALPGSDSARAIEERSTAPRTGPTTGRAFFDAVGSTEQAELDRYDAVIFFESAAVGGISVEGGNPTRIESNEQAIGLDRRLRRDLVEAPALHRRSPQPVVREEDHVRACRAREHRRAAQDLNGNGSNERYAVTEAPRRGADGRAWVRPTSPRRSRADTLPTFDVGALCRCGHAAPYAAPTTRDIKRNLGQLSNVSVTSSTGGHQAAGDPRGRRQRGRSARTGRPSCRRRGPADAPSLR